MDIGRGILSTGLIASGLLGLRILLVDRWLWIAAPSHAYGLAAFVAVDTFLTVAVIARVAFSATMSSAAAVAQLGAMLGDLAAGQPAGVFSIAFRNYLLMDTSFVALMVIQISIVFAGLGMVIARLLHQHPEWAVLLHRK